MSTPLVGNPIKLSANVYSEATLTSSTANAQASMGSAAIRKLAGVSSGAIRLSADCGRKANTFVFVDNITTWTAGTVYTLSTRASAAGWLGNGQQLIATINISTGVIVSGMNLDATNLDGNFSSITVNNNGYIHGGGGTGCFGTGFSSFSTSSGSGGLIIDSPTNVVYGANNGAHPGGVGLLIQMTAITPTTAGLSKTAIPVTINGTGYIYGGGGGGGGGSAGLTYNSPPGSGYKPLYGGGGGGGRGGVGQAVYGSLKNGNNTGQGGAGVPYYGVSFATNGATGSSGTFSSAGNGGAGYVNYGNGGSGGLGGSWGAAGYSGGVSYNTGNGYTLNPNTWSYYSAGGAGGYAVVTVSSTGNTSISYGATILSNMLGGISNQ